MAKNDARAQQKPPARGTQFRPPMPSFHHPGLGGVAPDDSPQGREIPLFRFARGERMVGTSILMRLRTHTPPSLEWCEERFWCQPPIWIGFLQVQGEPCASREP